MLGCAGTAALYKQLLAADLTPPPALLAVRGMLGLLSGT
jgi:hypothetical protein